MEYNGETGIGAGANGKMGIGARIKTLRERKGWSQAALAREAGVTQPTIAKLEADPNRQTKRLAEIARALDVEPGELDPKFYHKKAVLSAAETKLAARSADDWDRLIYAALEEAFRLAEYPPQTAAEIAGVMQAAIDGPWRVPPGQTDSEVVRRVVRNELGETLRTGRKR